MTNRLPLILSVLALVLAPIGAFAGSYVATGPAPTAEPTAKIQPATPTLKGAILFMPHPHACPAGTTPLLFLGEVAMLNGGEVTVLVPGFRGEPVQKKIPTVSLGGLTPCQVN